MNLAITILLLFELFKVQATYRFPEDVREIVTHPPLTQDQEAVNLGRLEEELIATAPTTPAKEKVKGRPKLGGRRKAKRPLKRTQRLNKKRKRNLGIKRRKISSKNPYANPGHVQNVNEEEQPKVTSPLNDISIIEPPLYDYAADTHQHDQKTNNFPAEYHQHDQISNSFPTEYHQHDQISKNVPLVVETEAVSIFQIPEPPPLPPKREPANYVLSPPPALQFMDSPILSNNDMPPPPPASKEKVEDDQIQEKYRYRDALVRGVLYGLVSITRFAKRLSESTLKPSLNDQGEAALKVKFAKSLNTLRLTGNLTGCSRMVEKTVKKVVGEINENKCTSIKHIFRRIISILPQDYQFLFIRAGSAGDSENGKAIVYTCPSGSIIESLVKEGVAPKILPVTCALGSNISSKNIMDEMMPIDVPLMSLKSKKKQVKAARYLYHLASVVWYQDDYVWSASELHNQKGNSKVKEISPSTSVVLVYRYRREANGNVAAVEKHIIDPLSNRPSAKMVLISPAEASADLNSKNNRLRLFLYERVRETRVSLAARFRSGLSIIDYPVGKLLGWFQRIPTRLTAILHAILSQMSLVRVVGLGALVVLVVAVVLSSAGIVPGPFFVMSNFYNQPMVSQITLPIATFLQSSRQTQCEMLLKAFTQIQGISQQLLGFIAVQVMPSVFGMLAKGMVLAKDAIIGDGVSGGLPSVVIDKAIELSGQVMENQTIDKAGEASRLSSLTGMGMSAYKAASSSISNWFGGSSTHESTAAAAAEQISTFAPCEIIARHFGL